MSSRRLLPLGLLFVVLSACSSSGDKTQSTFAFLDTAGAMFHATTSDASVIAKARSELNKPVAERGLHINGAIALGAGEDNSPWRWHFVPDQWDLVEVSMELCDGTCQIVDNDVETWVNEIGRFCPWGSHVVAEVVDRSS